MIALVVITGAAPEGVAFFVGNEKYFLNNLNNKKPPQNRAVFQVKIN
ncbi:hypothetical protein [Chryseobacterium gleum]|nr:hypothetical protein [Chryseobacterium gleum]MCE4063474.1 hypothetical protein [Chryseobacterium gleum]